MHREFKQGQMCSFQMMGQARAAPVVLIEYNGYDKLLISRGKKPNGVWMALFLNGKIYQVAESNLDKEQQV